MISWSDKALDKTPDCIAFEDDYVSDGSPGLVNFLTSMIEPLEAQGLPLFVLQLRPASVRTKLLNVEISSNLAILLSSNMLLLPADHDRIALIIDTFPGREPLQNVTPV
jgi:hypothetical protein